ncbi:MAG: hypothetical protein Ct9H90mP8_2770 [Pseudomonadota bacterium]|nr:MAG: hypothetical protein Ct9H90mP8_2770 [Pseudomonadota bacterium]
MRRKAFAQPQSQRTTPDRLDAAGWSALGIFLVFQNHQKTEKQLSSRLEEKKLQLEQLQLLAREWEMLQQEPSAPVMKQPLSSFIENVARSFAIQDNLQLNVLPQVEEETEGVQVRLDRLKLDQLMDMLYQLENHRPVLRLSS